jgi:hypothetical protein
VLKLLAEHRIDMRFAARLPLVNVGEAHDLLVNWLDLVGRVLALAWAS